MPSGRSSHKSLGPKIVKPSATNTAISARLASAVWKRSISVL